MAGVLLVGTTILGALVVAIHQGPNPVDRWGFSAIARNPDSAILIHISKLGDPLVLVLGTLGAALLAFRRDRILALACLIGPVLAALLVELALKPLVGRRFEGVLSFPSGNVVAVATVAAAWILAVPRRVRPLAVVIGVLSTGAMAVAVTGLRWHYPTDALAGALFGTGVVFLVDGVLHLPDVGRWLPGMAGGSRGRRAGA
jgi:membrane-associated phospholipid phosphatase